MKGSGYSGDSYYREGKSPFVVAGRTWGGFRVRMEGKPKATKVFRTKAEAGAYIEKLLKPYTMVKRK